jgi:hypothetical protein
MAGVGLRPATHPRASGRSVSIEMRMTSGAPFATAGGAASTAASRTSIIPAF